MNKDTRISFFSFAGIIVILTITALRHPDVKEIQRKSAVAPVSSTHKKTTNYKPVSGAQSGF